MFGQHAIAPVAHPQATAGSPELLLGTSARMREVERALVSLAAVDVNLLIEGEPGSGKRELAEAIHRRRTRSQGRLRVLPLRLLSEAQLEQELYGREGGGAPAGDVTAGTLYLEAIEALAPRAQGRLAGALTDRGVLTAARIITGTAAPLEELVRRGGFRRDLYHALGIVRLAIPPLRDRPEDIAPISERVVRRWCEEHGVPRVFLARAVLHELASYGWPGNTRELQETLEAALALARGRELTVERLRMVLGRRPQRHAAADICTLRTLERDYIASVLIRCDWNQSLAARRLGIGRNTLLRKIKSFGLERLPETA